MPEFLIHHLSETEGELQTKLKQLNHSTALLKNQKLRLKRQPASKVHSWKTENEIPNQIEHIRREEIRLRLKLDSLQKRQFSELEMFRLYVAARNRTSKKSSLPTLATSIELETSVFGDKIHLRPLWIYPSSNPKEWIVKHASSEALLSFSGSMITDDLRQAFNNKTLPQSFSLYAEFVRFPLNTGEQNIQPTNSQLATTQYKYVTPHQLVLSGASAFNRWNEVNTDSHNFLATSSTHLAVQASLDLGCLKQTHWTHKVENTYEPLLKMSNEDEDHSFQHVDPRSLKALSLLKNN